MGLERGRARERSPRTIQDAQKAGSATSARSRRRARFGQTDCRMGYSSIHTTRTHTGLELPSQPNRPKFGLLSPRGVYAPGAPGPAAAAPPAFHASRPRRRARRAPTPYARRPPLLDEEEVLPAIAADAEVRTPVPDEPCDAANRPDRRTHLASRAPTWHLI